MTAAPTDGIATLRIEIKYIEPLIWRRVAVRSSINLMGLHMVIQATVGWLDYHLWEFAVGERKYSILDPDRPHVKNGATTQLATVLASGMTEFDYVYDFGDNWEHRIIVEGISKAETGAKYPRFLGGERRCPPEDCGGPPGYFDFIENIAARTARKRKRRLIGTAAPTTSMTLIWSRSTLRLVGSLIPTEQGDQGQAGNNPTRIAHANDCLPE